MARPRIFISSTFYDLRQVRADLNRFITGLGYESVLSEHGTIPYGPDEAPKEAAIREVQYCDMLVAIVGGRFGGSSNDKPYSIVQAEIKAALESSKPVYIFVDQATYGEFSTYLVNKGTPDIKFKFADDVRIYEFLEEIEALPKNNPISPFQTAQDIIDFLREQWAANFQRLLQDKERLAGINLTTNLVSTSQTLNDMVNLIIESQKDMSGAIQQILMANHPLFIQFKNITKVPYRVYFTNHEEMSANLKARGYSLINVDEWDDPNFEEWRHPKQERVYLQIYSGIFDAEGKLKVYTPNEWKEEWFYEAEYVPAPELL